MLHALNLLTWMVHRIFAFQSLKMKKKVDKDNSALNVMKGIDAPESVDANAAKRFLKKRKKDIDVNLLVERILARDKTALSSAITLIESVHPKHREPAEQIIEKCLPF